MVTIADGDTITVLRGNDQMRIELRIDCPERSQAFSKKPKQVTSEMVFGDVVEVGSITVQVLEISWHNPYCSILSPV